MQAELTGLASICAGRNLKAWHVHANSQSQSLMHTVELLLIRSIIASIGTGLGQLICQCTPVLSSQDV